ncbi:MAG: hypothetical protein LBS73_06010 [Campylobacteraceae bacterium]|jgi:hypothetical protein|nr:hypothetical protein [Campylobacteraceae bacterium]
MYRYFTSVKRYFLLLFFAFSLSLATPQSTSNVSIDKQIFAGEDLLILQALDAQQRGEYKNAASFYAELYEKSGREEYLKNSIRLFLAGDDMSVVEKLVQRGFKNYPQDFDYERFYIAKLLKENNISAAKDEALVLLGKENNEQNLRLAGSIYLYLQEYGTALDYLERAYTFSNNEQVLLQIVDINIRLGKTDEAISQLETYTRINGCSINSCYKLIDIYSKQKNIDGLFGVYKRLYDKFENDEYAQKVFEILIFQNKRAEAIKFLEQSKYRPEILIEMYTVEKQFDKAIALAKKIYDNTGDLEYLSKIAILEYESASKKTDALLSSVSEKFERSINDQSEPLYMNYYGYLLIDHERNITKGIDLVKQALYLQPDSPYYQDSLAWGLYKQKNCKEAYDIMQKVVEKLSDKEILGHFNLIKSCVISSEKKAQQ